MNIENKCECFYKMKTAIIVGLYDLIINNVPTHGWKKIHKDSLTLKFIPRFFVYLTGLWLCFSGVVNLRLYYVYNIVQYIIALWMVQTIRLIRVLKTKWMYEIKFFYNHIVMCIGIY